MKLKVHKNKAHVNTVLVESTVITTEDLPIARNHLEEEDSALFFHFNLLENQT